MSQDLLFNEDWQAYRQSELELGAQMVHRLWAENADPAYLKGAIDMLRMIVKIPEKYAKTEEAKAAAAALIQAAFHQADMSLLRKMLSDQAP